MDKATTIEQLRARFKRPYAPGSSGAKVSRTAFGGLLIRISQHTPTEFSINGGETHSITWLDSAGAEVGPGGYAVDARFDDGQHAGRTVVEIGLGGYDIDGERRTHVGYLRHILAGIGETNEPLRALIAHTIEGQV